MIVELHPENLASAHIYGMLTALTLQWLIVPVGGAVLRWLFGRVTLGAYKRGAS